MRQLAQALSLTYERVETAEHLRRLLSHPQLAIYRPAAVELTRPMAAAALLIVLVTFVLGAKRWRRKTGALSFGLAFTGR